MKSILNRRNFFAVLVALMVMCITAGVANCGTYNGGMGEPNNPYLISTAEDLNDIGNHPEDFNKHFIMVNDINLADYTGTQFNIIGDSFSGSFSGVFDGNGHTISNFTWSSSDYSSYIALFGRVYAGEIRNLGMENVDVNVIQSSDFVAGLVGFNQYGVIINCYVTGTILALQNAGGVVGYNDGTISGSYFVGRVSGTRYGLGGLAGISEDTISNCYSAGEVSGERWVGGLVGSSMDVITNCYSSASVTGTYYVAGGLVGESWAATISNCYATGEVSGDYGVGGLSGYSWGCTISNCYAAGAVDGNDEAGGLVGHDYNNSYSKCFWDSDVNPDVNGIADANDPNVIGKTTVEMQDANTFIDAGWDFNTPIWTIDEGVDYPRLWWETALIEAPVLHAEPDTTIGTSNTIFWDQVAEANDYYAECANDANFTGIVDNSGWIADTNYTFTGLELGQRYWYRVKVRDVSATESDWSNVESSLQVTLTEAVQTVLDANSLKNANMKNAFLNKIDAALQMIDEGQYEGALNKLENDILQKTDGCAETGAPDKNDWITSCEEQGEVYPLIIETIEYVRNLME